MNRPITSGHILEIIGWILFRLVILNAIILALAYIFAMSRNIFEPTDRLLIQFPLQLYVTALFLTNLVYIIGNVFEAIYQKLWNQKIDIRNFERKFFKAGLIMIGVVNISGVLIYFVNFFK